VSFVDVHRKGLNSWLEFAVGGNVRITKKYKPAPL